MAETKTATNSPLASTDLFDHRHIGSGDADVRSMLDSVGYASLDELSAAVVPEEIALDRPIRLGGLRGEVVGRPLIE